MDIHTWGQILLAALTLIQGLYSSWDKRRIRDQADKDADKRAEQLLEAQRSAEMAQRENAALIARLQQITAQEIRQEINAVRDDVRVNTEITVEAKQVNTEALNAANNFNRKWQVLTKADTDRIFIGQEEVLLHDMQRTEKDTNETVHEIQQIVGGTNNQG